MNWRKNILMLLLAGMVIVAAVLSVSPARGNREARVAAFVREHRAELEQMAADALAGRETAGTYRGVTVDGVFPGEHTIVQFFYTGAGLVPSPVYCGFYYSEDDVPAAFQNCGSPLVEASGHEWTWEDGTDNGGRTARIEEHWFYYEAWF